MIKAINISDIAIQKTHCDYIIEKAKELKALISYDNGNIIHSNKVRAMSDIANMMISLNEIKDFIDEQ